MPIWKATPVEQQPNLTLNPWRVIEVVWPVAAIAAEKGVDNEFVVKALAKGFIDVTDPARPRSRHFVGYALENREGRVSSPIIEFDVERRRGRTRSGRCYLLGGNPGGDADARYVLEGWLQGGLITEYCDVTEDVLNENI